MLRKTAAVLAVGLALPVAVGSPPSEDAVIAELIRFASVGAFNKLHLERADAIFEARVKSVEPSHPIVETAGDWAWELTGYRLGIPEGTTLTVRVDEVVNHRGRIQSGTELLQAKPQLVTDGPGELSSGHRYVFFCASTSEGLRVQWFADLAEWGKRERGL